MRAKFYAAAMTIALLSAASCARLDLQRFAPPGLVKYEDLAGDEPPNPEIQERIAERRKATDPSFPNLSEQPEVGPVGLPVAEKNAELEQLRKAREDLQAGVEADQAAAETERVSGVFLPGEARNSQRSLEEARDALGAAIEKADAAARKERGLPPRVKPKKSE